MQKGYISETIGGGRIVSHGRIQDLTNGFSLPNGEPFTVYVRPISNVSSVDTTLNVKLYQEDKFAPAPIVYNDWSPLVITEIAPDSTLLKGNELYWGSGSAVDGL